MNALMICFLAAAMATLGSRWWLLAQAAQHRLAGWTALLLIASTAILASALSAAFGATLAAQFAGRGMLLLLAIALGFAAIGLAWPAKPLSAALTSALSRPLHAGILLLAAMVSDSAPFIILAATAWTNAPLLAAAGGASGLVLAAVVTAHILPPNQTLPAWLHHSRRAMMVVLAVTAAIAAVLALGLA